MAKILLLGPAGEAARVRHDVIDASTLRELLSVATERYGNDFARILEVSQVWVNGNVAESDQTVGPQDEVAVLPPVSGG